MEMSYHELTTGELVAYYKRVRDYIEQGFRVDGLRDELQMILEGLKCKSIELSEDELKQYLVEIGEYLKNIRH